MPKFRLLGGLHAERTEEIDPTTGINRTRIYKTGDIIETETDLIERFNPKDDSLAKKFELVGAPQQQEFTFAQQTGETVAEFKARMDILVRKAQEASEGAEDTYDAMTDEELKKHAADEEIEVEGNTREALLAAVRRK